LPSLLEAAQMQEPLVPVLEYFSANGGGSSKMLM
jgi:hypothetical protein